MNFIANNSVLLAQKSLDYLWQKQSITLENLANSETPGFKGKYVTFEEELRRKLSSNKNSTRSNIRNEILNSKINVRTTENESARMDGNNVDVTVESAELARATLQYEFMARAINDDFTILRTAIRGQ